jgi:integrase/recombinase XerC
MDYYLTVTDGRFGEASTALSKRHGRPLRKGGRRSSRDEAVSPDPLRVGPPSLGRSIPSTPLRPLVDAYAATCGLAWQPITRRKYAVDLERFLGWLEHRAHPVTTAALDLPTLAAYVASLRERPKATGGWRGTPGAVERAIAEGGASTLSANSINCYVRPLRSFVGWLVDEGYLAVDPFRKARRPGTRAALLPREETPAKSATLEDLRALERGCSGDAPIDLRDRALVAVLVTTAARNSSVRLLRLDDVDFERGLIRFVRAKGAKTLEVALHPEARIALDAYLPEARAALLGPHPDTGFLFPAKYGAGEPLGANALSLMLTRRYRAGGGTLPYFGSHRIRHATATLLVNNGMPLDEVSRYLGHSSTAVTRRYARHTPETLGTRVVAALARAGLTADPAGPGGDREIPLPSVPPSA